MPFGIIDTKDDAPLAGTEYLIQDDSASSQTDLDTTHLKRVLYKVKFCRVDFIVPMTIELIVSSSPRASIPSWYPSRPMTTPTTPL